MKFTVLTLFPDFVNSFFMNGMISRAVKKKIISCISINIRDFAFNHHKTVDDKPYGGGCGMVIKPEPLYAAVKYARKDRPDSRVILMTPQGRPFDQKKAWDFAKKKKSLVFICGRYEGIDERINYSLVDEEISIGDYVMTGGELAAMVIIDSVTRLLPDVLGGKESVDIDSFQNGRLEYAHYTRPSRFKDMDIPDVLLSGNHKKIEKWRITSSLKRTFLKRPDLFTQKKLKEHEKQILKKWCRELEELIKK
ncbi:MAG: tRNA (guanosine(37)-N1)-methyltransferase TrmD [Desulfobacteraceae bacterium 4572_130]|nr:MAG: tRNA (guanosine(37)-N1)-methyltransferase TrmD [Desulfobacteraceae bacterium 4572_130]